MHIMTSSIQRLKFILAAMGHMAKTNYMITLEDAVGKFSFSLRYYLRNLEVHLV